MCVGAVGGGAGGGKKAERKGRLPVVLFLDLGNGVLAQTGVT